MADDRNRDRAYLQNPNAWGTWPVVPVKTVNRGLARRVGVVIDESRDQGWRVLLTNMFDFDPKAEAETFPSLDALLAVWQVD